MKFLISILVCISIDFTAFAYDESVVIEEADFQKLSLQMQKNKMGLVMMLHAEHCPYCEVMDEQILSPMERSGEYKKRVFIRKLQIDKPEYVTDFEGKRIAASELANKYDSQLTPTLVFLDQNGKEGAVKIIGINSLEFFGASVDEQINELLNGIRAE